MRNSNVNFFVIQLQELDPFDSYVIIFLNFS